ncbi:hypothetical protein BAE44_0005609 [Dichanthelium oligosanthes]|uniref:F-box domain-containing protein n=1 Tax=Dichanthelium oligosanthes TaxID=888268 RepID=A0A1E5W7I5_9POAL|nr:hypothetical protein BAE44_0005609 [Dichanthelium oligosanthes]
MPSSGGVLRSRAPVREWQIHLRWLPLDIIADIAARSDAATLVRYAATCRDARRRIVDDDPNFRGLLRLQPTDRFLLPLLRCHLMGPWYRLRDHLYMVDTTTADGTSRLSRAHSPSAKGLEPLESRDGLLLVTDEYHRLRVCDPATGRSQCLPWEPAFPHYDHYVLCRNL